MHEIFILTKASLIFGKSPKINEAVAKMKISLIFGRFCGLGIEKIPENREDFDFQRGFHRNP